MEDGPAQPGTGQGDPRAARLATNLSRVREDRGEAGSPWSRRRVLGDAVTPRSGAVTGAGHVVTPRTGAATGVRTMPMTRAGFAGLEPGPIHRARGHRTVHPRPPQHRTPCVNDCMTAKPTSRLSDTLSELVIGGEQVPTVCCVTGSAALRPADPQWTPIHRQPVISKSTRARRRGRHHGSGVTANEGLVVRDVVAHLSLR